jgi:hypothetical protein
MVYLIQGDEYEPSHQLLESLAAVLAESEDLTRADAIYRLRSSHGVLRFLDREEALRVASRFTELGFANFLLDELLPLPRRTLLTPAVQQQGIQPDLAVLARLRTSEKRKVTSVNPLRMRIAYGRIPVPGSSTQETTLTRRRTRFALDLFTRDSHWWKHTGTLPQMAEFIPQLDLSHARLSGGLRSIVQAYGDVPTFNAEGDHKKYLTWLFNLRYA